MRPPPDRSLLAPLLGLASLVLLAVALVLSPQPAGAPPTPLVAGLAAAGLLAELLAQQLPGFGFFSAGFAFWFALALLPAPGPTLAALAGTGSLTVRTLSRGQPDPAERFREGLGELFPLAAGLATLQAVGAAGLAAPLASLQVALPGVLAGSGAWLLASMLVPGQLLTDLSDRGSVTWGRMRQRLGVPLAALPALGVILAFLGQKDPWFLVPLALLGLGVVHDASMGASWARMEERRRLQRRLERTNQKLGEVERAEKRTSQELAAKVDEYSLLEALATTLAGCTSAAQTGVAALAMVRRLVHCQSAVVFLSQGERLAPLAWESPQQDRLAAWTLLHLSDPVVERAWRTGRTAWARPEDQAQAAALPHERSRLAVPIAGRGVLYVGTTAAEAFGPIQERLLGLVASQTALALQSSALLEDRERALGQHREAHQRLEGQVGGLEQVLQAVRDLLACPEPDALLDNLGRLLPGVVPHDLLVILAGDHRLVRGQEDPRAVDALVGIVRRNALPLLLEDARATRFAAPGPGMLSVLAVPLNLQGGSVGALVLGARGAGAFNRAHQDLAFTLAYQVAAAFHKAEMHRELVRTHRALQESQAHLVQSSKMAAVGQLAAGVAHELNTPLGAVLLGLDSALTALRSRPEKAEDRLQTARKALLQAREIVAKLLFYSRDARQGLRPTDLNQVVEDTLELLGHHLNLGRVQVHKDLAPLPEVLANQNEIQQVLTNLLLNARDALQDQSEGRRIRLATRTEADLAVVEVEDSGPGIPGELQDRLFEPFFTTKPVGQGTGLGLSVSMEIVRRHQGTLEFASEPGRTRFTVRLPAGSPAPEGG